MPYVQVQAKLDERLCLTEDYLSFINSFAGMACFSIIFLQFALLTLERGQVARRHVDVSFPIAARGR